MLNHSPAVLARKSEKTVRCSVSKSAQNISLLFNLCLCVHSTQSRPVASISKLNMPLKSTKKACHFLGGPTPDDSEAREFGELELDQISRSQTSVHGPDLKAKACLSTSRKHFMLATCSEFYGSYLVKLPQITHIFSIVAPWIIRHI